MGQPGASGSKRTVTIAMAILAAALAGCVGEGTDCKDGVCREIAAPGDVFIDNATQAHPRGTWEGCDGAFLFLHVTEQMIGDHLPADFVAFGSAPYHRQIIMLAIDCPRAVLGDHIAEPYRYLKVGMSAGPSNESWVPGGAIPIFIFETFVSDERSAEILRSWGLPAMHARIDISHMDTPIVERAEWSVQADDRSYAFFIDAMEQESGEHSVVHSYWAGDVVHHRIDANISRNSAQNVHWPTQLTMDGEAKVRQMLGTDETPFLIQPFKTFKADATPYPKVFSS